MKFKALLLSAASLAVGSSLSIGQIMWTDWSSHTIGNPGSASGVMGGVGVSYLGEVLSQTQTGGVGGTNYYNPPAPYLSATIPNLPSHNDIITLAQGPSTGNVLTL
ncbi:MAG: hypothetical protein EA425_05430 [Puniceicoccaceae bacterium]|nr:MAG: hypothetical protein EA425_05430 [Puniceicoccaceae bacterium]